MQMTLSRRVKLFARGCNLSQLLGFGAFVSQLPRHPVDAMLAMQQLVQRDQTGDPWISNWTEIDLISLLEFLEGFEADICPGTFDFAATKGQRAGCLPLCIGALEAISRDDHPLIVERAKERARANLKNYSWSADGDFFVNTGEAALTAEDRSEIHKHLNSIRELISGSSLSDRKKNTLYRKLGKLAEEVDLTGTKTDRFAAFMIDMAHMASAMKQAGDEALQEAKAILRIVMMRRAENEDEQLPRPDEVLKLPNEEPS